MIYTNSEIAVLIDEYIHNEIHRALLKRRLIDGVTFEGLSQEFYTSVSQVKRIIYKSQTELFKHLKI